MPKQERDIPEEKRKDSVRRFLSTHFESELFEVKPWELTADDVASAIEVFAVAGYGTDDVSCALTQLNCTFTDIISMSPDDLRSFIGNIDEMDYHSGAY